MHACKAAQALRTTSDIERGHGVRKREISVSTAGAALSSEAARRTLYIPRGAGAGRHRVYYLSEISDPGIMRKPT